MHDDSLRRRLEVLNRGPLPSDAAGRTSAKQRDVGVLARRECAAPEPAALHGKAIVQPRPVKPIPGLLHRGDVVETIAGEHLRIRLPLEDLWPGGTRLAAARQKYLRHLHLPRHQRAEPTKATDAEITALAAALPDRALLLDLETCGLAGAALFLVGLLRQIGGAPTVELLLARNYAEEQAILDTLWRTLAEYDVLVTFNGKSFDWPMVIDRSTRHLLHRTRGDRKMVHVDVLHHARRRWRGQLPNCQLQTLEQLICRRRRTGDIAGHRIPAAYADFVRTGFERDIDSILYHNAVDLVTLLDLALRLAG